MTPLAEPTGRIRSYFIAAEEADWDFGPTGANGIVGTPFDADASATYMSRNDTRFGSRVRKARYVEYADATFSARRAVPEEWQHAGILGPVLRAEVGDEIRITFRNRCGRAYTMHPHGVVYVKADEGANYADGLSAGGEPGPLVRCARSPFCGAKTVARCSDMAAAW